MKEFDAVIFWSGVALVLIGLGVFVYSRWVCRRLNKSQQNTNLLAAILAWMAGGFFVVRSEYFSLPLVLKLILLVLLMPTNLFLLPLLTRVLRRSAVRHLES